jgi:hypothetical protein
MPDERLRELERRWRESGAIDDEAAYLRQRVKVGELSPESVELAAFLGHPGALVATATFSGVTPGAEVLRSFATGHADGRAPERPAWLVTIQRLGGDEALRRLAASALRRSHFTSDPPGRDAASSALEAVEAWVREPTDDGFAACRRFVAADAYLTREIPKLVVTWGGGAVTGPDVLVATSRILHLFFVDDTVRERAIVAAALELALWALGQRDVLAERAASR